MFIIPSQSYVSHNLIHLELKSIKYKNDAPKGLESFRSIQIIDGVY